STKASSKRPPSAAPRPSEGSAAISTGSSAQCSAHSSEPVAPRRSSRRWLRCWDMTSGPWPLRYGYSITFQESCTARPPPMPANVRPHPRTLAFAIAICLALPVHAADDRQQARHDREPKDLAAVEVRATPLADTAETLATPVD